MTRFIDADKLETHEEIVPLGNGMYETTFIVYKDDIDEQPTIDAVPIRHGKWYELAIYDGCEVDLRCSNCGATVSGFVQDYKFCPYCGARMDEK